MDRIKEQFASKIGPAQAEIKAFLAKHGEDSLGEITVAQAYQGMRGMTALICETSKLDSQEGIRFRGYSIPELQAKLKRFSAAQQNVKRVGVRNATAVMAASIDAELVAATGDQRAQKRQSTN